MNIEDFFISLKKQIEKDCHVKCSDMLNTYGNEIISYFLHLEKFIYDEDNSNNGLILKCNLSFNIEDDFMNYFLIKNIEVEVFTEIFLSEYHFIYNTIDSDTLLMDCEVHNTEGDVRFIFIRLNKEFTDISERIRIKFNNILKDFTKMVNKINER